MRVLIIKTSALGDIVQAFPVAEYLKKVHGVQRIGWIAEEAACELLESNPFIDVVIPINTKAIKKKFPSLSVICECYRQRLRVREEKWDLVFDLQGNFKSACCTWMARARQKIGWGMKTAPEGIASFVLNEKVNPPEFVSMREQYLHIPKTHFRDSDSFQSEFLSLMLTDRQQELFSNELSRLPHDRPCWVISLGSTWPNKLCTTEEMALALASIQKENNVYFVFTAATMQELNEAGTCLKKLPHSIPGNVLYQLPLPVVQKLMIQTDRFVGVDSLMLHLAATTGIPTFSLFGPSSSNLYAPKHPLDRSVQGGCPYGLSFNKRCANLRTCHSGACIKQLKRKQIEIALKEWVAETTIDESL